MIIMHHLHDKYVSRGLFRGVLAYTAAVRRYCQGIPTRRPTKPTSPYRARRSCPIGGASAVCGAVHQPHRVADLQQPGSGVDLRAAACVKSGEQEVHAHPHDPCPIAKVSS